MAWLSSAPAPDGDAAWKYLIERVSRRTGGRRVLAVLPATRTSYLAPDSDQDGEYVVRSLDRFHNESDALSSAVLAAGMLPAPSYRPGGSAVSQVVDGGEGLLLLGYTIEMRSRVRVTLVDARGTEIAALSDGIQNPGTYLLGIDRGEIGGPITGCMIETGASRELRTFPAPANAE